MMNKIFNLRSNSGMTLFISVVVMSILLFISFAVINITLKATTFATSGRDSQYAFYAADSGIECALYWDSKLITGWNGPYPIYGSAFDPAVSGSPISCGGVSISTGPAASGTSTPTLIGGGGGVISETVWVEDSMPGGVSGGDPFNWVSSNPTPFSGTFANRSQSAPGTHQQYFYNAPAFPVSAGEYLFAYIYIDSLDPPSEVMLQWNSDGWDHRAYWGANNIPWGVEGTVSRRHMGPLPEFDQWVRLEVPASLVGLEGTSLNGMAFTLYGGHATWDKGGKSAIVGGGNLTSTFGFTLNQGNNPAGYCAIVTVTKNPGGSTYIKSRGYNSCDSSQRRVERGIEVTY